MAKLRKTLGSPTEPAVVALMESMEGKSKETLTTWAMAYVTEKWQKRRFLRNCWKRQKIAWLAVCL